MSASAYSYALRRALCFMAVSPLLLGHEALMDGVATTAPVKSERKVGEACRRRQKKYESPQSTPVPTDQLHASGPSPTERWAISAEPRLIAKPAYAHSLSRAGRKAR
jgi:hypothetical protein